MMTHLSCFMDRQVLFQLSYTGPQEDSGPVGLRLGGPEVSSWRPVCQEELFMCLKEEQWVLTLCGERHNVSTVSSKNIKGD